MKRRTFGRSCAAASATLLFVGALLTTRAAAAFLPDQVVPPAPFPLVISQVLDREFVAPGVERASYHLQTSAGPLVISLVAFDPREPTLRLGTVLARDRIVSAGETVSSMAERTGAVAGINADYFDIGNTNSPLGVLAQNGVLVRSPSARTALTVTRDRSMRFESYRFTGSAVVNGAATISITTLNEWPPHDGAALLTPGYGALPASPDCVIAELTPLPNTTPAGAPPSGRYRVTQIDTGTAPSGPVFALALGPAAQSAVATLPDVGDLIDISVDTDPPLAGVQDAIGGGPTLLSNGSAVDDPASPGYATRAKRIPVAAAARLHDGSIALVVVDGRRPAISIGVDRAELTALLSALGASDAMQFDSGGSATLVARVLGEDRASVQNDPSDGVERPVADGLFLYSTTPLGPPARLVVRPSTIEALPNTAVALRSTLVDAGGHPLGPASGPWRIEGSGATIDAADVLRTAAAPQADVLQLSRGGASTTLPLAIVPAVSKIALTPDRPDVDPNTTVTLHAQAFDDRGRPIETGDRVRWTALRGGIDASGTFTAGDLDGFVTAAIGDVKSSETIHVGHHDEALTGFDSDAQAEWHFSSVPAGGPGTLAFTSQGTLQIGYDFRATERAAYANAALMLGEPLALSCAIDGDAGGAGVRVAVLDRYGERSVLTLAKTVDWTGAQRRTVRIPASLAPPIALQSIYVVGSLGSAPVKSSGTIGIRSCALTLPGTAPQTP
ncbi:MAG: phosphodiester glycosidase family protein [Candidatus Velthaea sp.]